jgi:hypothetical protein
LVQYSNDVVSSYLIRLYIARYHEKYDDRMNEDKTANVLCSMAIDFDEFLTCSLTSSDEHLILIVNFLLVSSDFLEFVKAYRAQDSISIENGYQTFAPIWKLLGQVKYLETTWEQMENLYTKFPYSRLQEIRINRQVRNYPGLSGKSAVAQDEWLELNNKEHANLPSVRSLEGMCRQGHYVGITQRCKRFIDAIYSAGSISERTVYRSGMGAMGRGQLEKMLLAEAVHLFLGDGCLSHDNEQNFKRKLQPGAIAALENQLKTKLNRKQLDQETRINSEDGAANCLFNGVVHIYNRINQLTNREENVGGGTLLDNVKDVLDKVMEYEPSENVPDINDLVFDEDNNEDKDDDNDDEVITGLEVVTVQSRLFLSDLQGLGWATIDKVKVNEVRQHAKDRLSRKRDMMKYIVLQVIDMKSISGKSPYVKRKE